MCMLEHFLALEPMAAALLVSLNAVNFDGRTTAALLVSTTQKVPRWVQCAVIK